MDSWCFQRGTKSQKRNVNHDRCWNSSHNHACFLRILDWGHTLSRGLAFQPPHESIPGPGVDPEDYKVVFLEEGGVCHRKYKPTLWDPGLVIKVKIVENHEIIHQSSTRIALNL